MHANGLIHATGNYKGLIPSFLGTLYIQVVSYNSLYTSMSLLPRDPSVLMAWTPERTGLTSGSLETNAQVKILLQNLIKGLQ